MVNQPWPFVLPRFLRHLVVRFMWKILLIIPMKSFIPRWPPVGWSAIVMLHFIITIIFRAVGVIAWVSSISSVIVIIITVRTVTAVVEMGDLVVSHTEAANFIEIIFIGTDTFVNP